jgi:NADH-quinone oxidoreductase subunit H
LFRLQKDVLMLVGSAFIAALFLGAFQGGVWLGGLQLLVKTIFIVFLLSIIRAAFARIRIDQIVTFSWKYLAPVGLIQLLIVLLLKGKGVL